MFQFGPLVTNITKLIYMIGRGYNPQKKTFNSMFSGVMK